MKKKIRMLSIDSVDGIGKTSFLTSFLKKLKETGRTVHSTRLLGGSGEDEFQLALRKILLHPKFPKNSIELEEQLFALTDLEGLRAAEAFLQANPTGLVVKDRDSFSHIGYALAKNMPLKAVMACHAEVLRMGKVLNQEYGALNILLKPDSMSWLRARIESRAATQGTEIVARLENDAVQAAVFEAIDIVPHLTEMQGLDFEVVTVSESDSMKDVYEKVMATLEKYEI